jgi:hypothetical protein
VHDLSIKNLGLEYFIAVSFAGYGIMRLDLSKMIYACKKRIKNGEIHSLYNMVS